MKQGFALCVARYKVKRSWRGRGMIDDSGTKVLFFIRRLRCSSCECIHHELPDIFVPYKRHSAKTIQKILESNVPSGICDVPCESATISGILLWWQAIVPYFINILKSLYQKLGIVYNGVPAFKELIRAVLNSGNWIFASSLCTRSACKSPP